MSRKAQASLEFMATYGWAILAVLVAIGALSYFLMSPNNMIPNVCVLFPGVVCEDGKFSASNSSVTFSVENDLNKVITTFNITADRCAGSSVSANGGLRMSEKEILILPCTSANLTQGDSIKMELTVYYVVSSGGTSIDHISKGQISGLVEP